MSNTFSHSIRLLGRPVNGQATMGSLAPCLADNLEHLAAERTAFRQLTCALAHSAKDNAYYIYALCSSLFPLPHTKNGMQRSDDAWAGDTLAINS